MFGLFFGRSSNLMAGLAASASAVLASLWPATQVSAEALSPQAAYAIARCERCHGAGGDSGNAYIPRLNGQRPDYIVKRLKDFIQPVPRGPHAVETMGAATANAPDTLSAAIAAHFARQKPVTAVPGPLAEQGQFIYQSGIDAEGVVACAQCHGDSGQGHDAVPRLAGQHVGYLTTQLWLFRFPLRASRLMHANTEHLTPDQVNALVSYLGAK